MKKNKNIKNKKTKKSKLNEHKTNNNKRFEFYIKDGLVFNSESILIEIPNKDLLSKCISILNTFDYNESISENNLNETVNWEEIINKNSKLLNEIKLLNKEFQFKKIEVSSLIENFKDIKNKIELKLKSKKFIQPKVDNYRFIEITSSIIILDQIIKEYNFEVIKDNINIDLFNEDSINFKLENINLNNNRSQKFFLFEEIYNFLNNLNHQQKYEKKYEDYLNEEITYNKNFKKNIEDKISENIKYLDKFQEEINKIEIKYESNTEKLKKLKENNSNNIENQIEKEIDSINKNISKEEFKIKKYKNNIEFIKNRIRIIKNKIKMGKSKCPNPILMIVTLGLIYWFKSSLCKYKEIYLENKINQINEDIIISKKNILSLKEKERIKIDELNELKLKLKIENTNKNKLEKEIIEKLNKLNKDNEITHSKLDSIKENITELEIELDKITTKIELLNNKIIFFKNNSSKEISKIVINILKKNFSILENILNKKNSLEKQRIKFEGEAIIKI